MASTSGYSAGRVYLQVVPSYRNFMNSLRRDARGPLGKAIADVFEKQLGEAGYGSGENFGKNMAKGIEKSAELDAATASLKKKLNAALGGLGDGSDGFKRQLQSIQRELDVTGKATDRNVRQVDELSQSMIAAAERTDDLARKQNLLASAKTISPSTYQQYTSALRDAERESRELERAEAQRGKAHRDTDRDTNIASRGLLGLRDRLTGLKGDSQDGANAFRFFNFAILAAAALGPSIIPVLVAIAGGLALIGPGAIAAAAGLGVFGLALSGIGGAVKAMGEQQDATAASSRSYQRAVSSAARAVADAERGVADARRQSAEGVRRALESQRNAERRLADAQRDARKAQQDLTEARKQAKQELMDLDNQMAQNLLDERQGVIDLFNAYNTYGATMSDGGATNLEKEQADIGLEQAELNLKRIREEQGRLSEEKKKADKGGVNGTDTVLRAQERLNDAIYREKEARRAVGEAARDVDRARADGARRVADAQRNLRYAQEDYNLALQGGAEAVDKVREAMDKLSPAGQRFARFIFSLRDGFYKLRDIAQEGVLPGLQDGIEAVLGKYETRFPAWLKSTSELIGDLSRKAGEGLAGDEWSRFFDEFGESSQVLIKNYSLAFGDFATGLANFFRVSLPYAENFSASVRDIGRSFRDWSNSAQGQKDIREFFEYLERIGPKVKDFFGAVARGFVNIGKGLAPIGESVLSYLTDFFNWVAKVDPKILTMIAAGIAAIIIAMQVSSGIVVFITVLGIITGAPMLAALAAIAGLAGAFFLLSRSGGETGEKMAKFKEKIQPLLNVLGEIWAVIKEQLVRTFNEALLPALKAIWGALEKDLIPALVKFWEKTDWVWKLLAQVVGFLVRTFIGGFTTMVKGVINILSGLLNFVSAIFSGDITGAFKAIWQIVKGIFQVFLGWIQISFIGGLWRGLAGFFTKKLPSMLKSAGKFLKDLFVNPFKAGWNLIQKILENVRKGFDRLRGGVGNIFKDMGSYILKRFGNPVLNVVDNVINKGLIAAVNKVAGWLGLGGKDGKVIGTIAGMTKRFATGGVLPGFTPGRDVHSFFSPTGGKLALSGGEAIMRPEWTKAVGGAKAVAEMNEKARKGMAFAKGGVVWPSKTRALSGSYAGHTGIDIRAPYGSNVYAATAGRVTSTPRWNYSYGNHIRMQGGGVTQIYAHLSRILARVGQIVGKGQTIGKVGSTGNSTGPHLHFEVRPGGTPGSAISFLRGAGVPAGKDSPLGNLSAAALKAVMNPLGYIKGKVSDAFSKVGGLTGGLGTMLKGVPSKFFGSIKDWFKDKAKDILGFLNPFGGPTAPKPKLYDNGGFIPPGVSTVMNNTGRPEPVLTGSQWDKLLDAVDGGTQVAIDARGRDLDAEEISSELLWALKKAKRRGKAA